MKAPPLPNLTSKPESRETTREYDAEDNEEPEGEAQSSGDDEAMKDVSEDNDSSSELESATEEEASNAGNRKRKRAAVDDLEESYMRRIAKEEQVEEEKRRSAKAKRQKVEDEEDGGDTSSNETDESERSGISDESGESEEDEESDKENEKPSVPMHESLTGGRQTNEVEKSGRTVFMGNVSTAAITSKSAKKTLLKHLASFLSTLPETTGPHKVESIRFRSTPFTSGGHIPKRASYARREVLDDTTPSTNAYAVYTTAQAARKAPSALNGTLVLDRHLRVDNIAHPSAIDHKRCVFVGNLDFVDQEQSREDEESKKKKNSKPADVEEGLWRTFNSSTGGSKGKKSSKVESVRVIRDRATRVGKGFAYVQFYDQNGVEEALLLDGKKFPPMLPRKLRVTRAKKQAKKSSETGQAPNKGGDKTLQGRAGKLLGKAGAAKLKTGANEVNPQGALVFEGHRASEDASSRVKVKTKSRGLKGKPKTRSSKRAAAYRENRGKKEKSKN